MTGNVLYFYLSGQRTADSDPNVTVAYAQAASTESPELIVEWTSHSDPKDVRSFQAGRLIHTPERSPTNAKHTAEDQQATARDVATSRGPAQGRVYPKED